MAAPLIVSVIWSLTSVHGKNGPKFRPLLRRLMIWISQVWRSEIPKDGCLLMFLDVFYVLFFLNHVISYWYTIYIIYIIYIHIYIHTYIYIYWPLVYHSLSYCNCWEMLRAGPSDPWWLAFLCRRLCFGVLKADGFSHGFSWPKKKRRKTWRN